MSNCLQLDHVDYAYGAAKIRVLSDVSADFESGKMYAITGPSGAGKSTLLSHMQQLVELLDDLRQRHGLHVGGHRDARDVRPLGGGDGQRVDVERTAGEQAGDTSHTPGRFSTSTDSV